jgi:hypothetical protein
MGVLWWLHASSNMAPKQTRRNQDGRFPSASLRGTGTKKWSSCWLKKGMHLSIRTTAWDGRHFTALHPVGIWSLQSTS